MKFLEELCDWHVDFGWKKYMSTHLINRWFCRYGHAPELYIVELILINKPPVDMAIELTKTWDDKAQYYFWYRESSFNNSAGVAEGNKYKAIFSFISKHESREFVKLVQSIDETIGISAYTQTEEKSLI